MIRPHILAYHQTTTASHTGPAKLPFVPSHQTFPRKICRHILFEKSRQYAPPGLVNRFDQFLIWNFKLVVQ